MSNITAYPTGTPKVNDLLLGTSVPLPNTDDQPTTTNFTVSSIAGFANPTAAYTTYVARWSQQGSSGVPVSIILQNTTGLTWTWTRLGIGSYDLTASASFTEKVYATVSAWEDKGISTPASTGSKSVSIKTAGPNYIRVTNIDNADGSFVDDVTNGMIEIRIYK